MTTEQDVDLQLSPDDALDITVMKMLATFGHCPWLPAMEVMKIDTEMLGDGMSKASFINYGAKFSREIVTPGGKPKRVNPAHLWLIDPRRINIRGQQMRPDMPQPLFEDAGELYGNTYRRQVHVAEGGDPEGGIALLEQLLPDPTERRWFTQWLAHKWHNPEVPGPGVVLVARHFGTGRGTLVQLVRRLFGSRYVKQLDFKTFAGKTYQSQYNTWMAESLIVVVNESSDDGGSTYASKRDTYERLKELIEPRAELRHFVRHGMPPFTAFSFTSFLIATNHVDALPLPAGDRRIWVGSCGEPREAAFWEKINRWMEVPENIGAFARWLEAVDLSAYSPYDPPPPTAGKQLMTDMSTSVVDRLLEGALEQLPGEVLLPEQIITAMRSLGSDVQEELPHKWEAVARRQLQSRLYRVGEKDGPGWIVRIANRKHPTYARTAAAARKWGRPGADTRAEALRNGDPGDTAGIAAALRKVRLTVVPNPVVERP